MVRAGRRKADFAAYQVLPSAIWEFPEVRVPCILGVPIYGGLKHVGVSIGIPYCGELPYVFFCNPTEFLGSRA